MGGAGSWSLGQGGPIDTRVVEGTVVLIAAVALHHEVSANRAVRHVCGNEGGMVRQEVAKRSMPASPIPKSMAA